MTIKRKSIDMDGKNAKIKYTQIKTQDDKNFIRR